MEDRVTKDRNSETISRETTMDVAKGIGILMVILAHIGVGDLGIWFYSFHLPVFFVISGYFFRPGNSFKEFAGKKVRTYVIPYFCFAGIITAFEYFLYGFSTERLISDIGNFLIQRRSTTLWFLATLFLAVLIFWWICFFCKNNRKKIIVICAVISGGFILYDEFVRFPLPWNLDTAFIVLFYMAVGYALKKRQYFEKMLQEKGKRWLHILILEVISGSCTVLNLVLCHETYEMFWCKYGIFPLTVTAACTGSMGIILLASFLKSKVLAYIGRNSMTFFALHQSLAMPLMYLLCWKLRINPDAGRGVIPGRMLVFVGSMGICWLIHVTIVKCKLNFMIGQTRRT